MLNCYLVPRGAVKFLNSFRTNVVLNTRVITMKKAPLVFNFIIAVLLRGKHADAVGDLQSDIALDMDRENNRFLSRQRRYLMFPEGSSFQLGKFFYHTAEK